MLRFRRSAFYQSLSLRFVCIARSSDQRGVRSLLMKITIRKAVAGDAQAVFDVRVEAIRTQCRGFYSDAALSSWTSGSVSERFIKNVDQCMHLAVVDGEIAGTGMIDLESGQIDAIFVHPRYTKRGIGRAMVFYLESLAGAAGIDQLNLESTTNAASFYRSLGFAGDEKSVHVSSKGIELECIPMTKDIVAGDA
jgi:GNAT superfamily N-acetyltransferase